jgi:hypothetical protein
MELKLFKRWNNIIALSVLIISSITYLLTIESTASFWDCGEFIASSYKLEVGHPPGNPVFQLFARIFTLFGDASSAAVLVNALSALCSAFTIFFLYLTIVHFGKRIIEITGDALTTSNAIALFGAGIVGSLAYCWSDTFWFSAVEGEVYAMSSLFTAVVFWAMLKWEDQADQPYANRWIILIAFLMGLSIGVHLLNLLTIPALVFIYYFKNYKITRKRTWTVLLLSIVILAFILYGMIPYIPKISAYVDLAFVNGFGLPVNSGALFFMLALIALGIWGFYYTYKKNKVLLNTIILCFTMIVIGYSTFAVVVIRSSANTPTNEYQPDNPFTLVRYLGREQYGSAPLIYGETYASPISDLKVPKYYNVVDGKYEALNAPVSPVYESSSKMLFPRMYQAGVDDQYIDFYNIYTHGKGKTIVGSNYKMPSFGANLAYFFDYQVDFMYLRYFMWNFAGRQNDLQGTVPGDLFRGNWESGIGFIDQARLGDQSSGPDYIVNSKAKNHFYFLPLILGLIGLLYQLNKDRKNWIVVGLLFLLTGLAIVVYLNQSPVQARERDYAYAGSFYVFTIWIGLAVMWIAELLKKAIKNPIASASIASALCLIVPLQMVSQTWDDHDRSGRKTSTAMAYNYLMSVDKNAILITHGDNDTFPLWYIQEVEGVRTDVRIMNTSLLGTDWYIDQMRWKQYESDPVPFSIERRQYLYGTNDYVQVYDRFNGKPILLKQAIDIFRNPKITVALSDGQQHNYIAAHKLLLPVNKENIRKYHIVADSDTSKVLDTIELVIPEGKSSLSKTELMILDMLANYQWDRPIYVLQRGGDINIGIKQFLQFDGFVYKFVPIKSSTGTTSNKVEQMDAEGLYNRIMNVYKWEPFADTTICVDYQNLLTFNSLISIRDIMVQNAKYLLAQGKKEKAVAVLDKMQKAFPAKNFPLNNSIISMINDRAVMDAISVYLAAGERAKADKLANAMIAETEKAIILFSKIHNKALMSGDYLEQQLSYVLIISSIYKDAGDEATSKRYSDMVDVYLKPLQER